MSASDRSTARPVALLARPGVARDRLREAVLAAGGALVLEEDPGALDPAVLQAVGPAMVLVALEPALEDALERLAPALEAPQLELMFEEAELAARREGWDAQRWTRHLAAKLQGHDQVLPPGQEDEALPLPEPGMPERPAERHADAPLQFHGEEAAQHLVMAVQLGGQVARPALRVPAFAARGQLGLLEHQLQLRPFQGRGQAFQRVLQRRLQRHQHHRRAQCLQHGRVQRARVFFQDQRAAGGEYRLAQAVAGHAGPRQQGHGPGGGAVTRGHGRSPAGRRRYASDPAPGTACRDSAARRSRMRAGGACRRCAR